MKKKVSLLFICFCFCAFLFSLSAGAASTSLTLDNGTEITLSQTPLDSFNTTCEVTNSTVLKSRTVYYLTQDTTIILPNACWFWEYGYYNDNGTYTYFEGGLGDGNSYCSLDFVENQTTDSNGNFEFIYCIELVDPDIYPGTDTETDDFFYFVVVAEDYFTSPVKSVNLTPTLTNTSSGIKVSWSKAFSATGYYVYRKTSSASRYFLIKTITSNSTLSYVDTAVKKKNGTTYYYKVVPYSGSNKGTSDAPKIVRLTSVTLSSVKNTASKKITVKWKKNAKATSYQIQYSTSKTFASGNKTVKVSGAKKVSKVISKLTKKKTYYVRIRAYKTVNGTTYYSAWSSKKSVKIKK